MRYRALRDLAGRPETDPEVRQAKAEVGTRGWARQILEARRPDGYWAGAERTYVPKYLSTNWMLLILSDLGMTRSDRRIAESCAIWIRRTGTPDGGTAVDGSKRGHLCTTGNSVRALIRLGYLDHPRVKSGLEWLVKNQSHLGGWSCFGSGRNLDSWEGLSAFAAYPRDRWNAGMLRAVERGAEFFLSRELMHQGDPYPPWSRFHYPVHYYYDLLVGLDLLTALGYASDPRMRKAYGVLEERRRPDGRWNLDAVHPDVEGPISAWFAAHPKRRPVPFALETPGRPSKMITLIARRVEARRDGIVDGPTG